MKGSISQAAVLGIDRQSCARHVAENVRKVFPGPFGAALQPIVYWVAKAMTKEEVDAAYNFVRTSPLFKAWSSQHDKFETYLRARQHEFCSFDLYERGLINYGELLSNGAEQNNASSGPLRFAALCEFIMGSLNKAAHAAFQRNLKATKCPSEITPNILKKMHLMMNVGALLPCKLIACDNKIAMGRVELGVRHTVTVKLVLETGEMLCPCRKPQMMGRPCKCICSLFVELQQNHNRAINPNSLLYKPFDKRWTSLHFQTESWRKQFCNPMLVPSINVDMLRIDNTAAFVRFKPKAPGRPSLKARIVAPARYVEPGAEDPERVRHCGYCSEPGHDRRSCRNPDLDYITANLLDDPTRYVELVDDPLVRQEALDELAAPTLEVNDNGDLAEAVRVDVVDINAALNGTIPNNDDVNANDVFDVDDSGYFLLGFQPAQLEIEPGAGENSDVLISENSRIGQEDLMAANDISIYMPLGFDVELAVEQGAIVDRPVPVPEAVPALGEEACGACKVTRVAEKGGYRIVRCEQCTISYHIKNDCANPRPNPNQIRGIDTWRCSVCRNHAAPHGGGADQPRERQASRKAAELQAAE